MSSEASTSALIDTHAHLDDGAFDHDLDEVLATAKAAGVRRIVNVGYRPARWLSTIGLTHRYSTIRHMLGLHPQHVDEWREAAKETLAELIRSSQPVAVGEIGFDYVRPGPSAAVQHAAFVDQVAIARRFDLPIVIHHRDAEADLIEALTNEGDLTQVLLHSFEGSSRLAQLAADRGFYVGIGGLATRARSEALRQVLATVALDRLVLETDSPYLVPAGVKERRNTPANVPLIVERLAPIWNASPTELAAITTNNAERFFGPLLTDGQ